MLTHSLRSLRRTPAFAIAAALTLALGIGSVAAAFTIAYGVLLDPLSYGNPDHLVSVGLRSTELQRMQQPAAVYYTYQRLARSVADIGFYRTGNANLAAGDGVSRRIGGTHVRRGSSCAPCGMGSCACALVAFGPADLPRLAELHMGAPTVAFVVALSMLAAVICTIVPLIHLRRAMLSISLRDGGRSETTGRVRQRLRATMAASQIAVAFVALTGSALLLRTFQRLGQERPGFDATNVLTIWTQLPFSRYGDSASVAFYARLAESVAALPGVVSAGVTTRLPLGGNCP